MERFESGKGTQVMEEETEGGSNRSIEQQKALEMVKGVLIQRGIDPEQYSYEQLESAVDRLKRLKAEMKKVSVSKEILGDTIRAIADVGMVPSVLIASFFDLVGELGFQDRSPWAQSHKFSMIKEVWDSYDELRTIFENPARKELIEIKKLGKKGVRIDNNE